VGAKAQVSWKPYICGPGWEVTGRG